MGRAFSTGADPLDWIFLTNMLFAQSESSLNLLVDVASSVAPCVINIVNGEFFGGYSVVVCEYPSGVGSPAFNYVSILGTQATGEILADILGSPLVPAPWLNEPLRGDVVAFFYINACFLLKAVRTVLKNENPTVFAGHSLGGASCQIMAAMLAALGYTVLGCYTIGSPKPGSKPFAASLTFPVFNAEAVGDVIPSLPQILKVPGLPWWANILAKKIGNATVWSQTGTLLTLSDDGALRSDGGQQYGDIKIAYLLSQYGFAKHSILNYFNAFITGHPTPADLQPCASGYEKPWRLFSKPDPPFPPQPPALLAPCVASWWNNKIFIYQVNYNGNQTFQFDLDDPPPTFPLLLSDPAPNPCCKSVKP